MPRLAEIESLQEFAFDLVPLDSGDAATRFCCAALYLVPVFDRDSRRRLQAIEKLGSELLTLLFRKTHRLLEKFRGYLHYLNVPMIMLDRYVVDMGRTASDSATLRDDGRA